MMFFQAAMGTDSGIPRVVIRMRAAMRQYASVHWAWKVRFLNRGPNRVLRRKKAFSARERRW